MNDIRQLIARGRLQEALEALVNAAPTHLQNDVTHLQSRYYTLARKEQLDLITNADAGLERNKITNAILQFADEIVADDSPPAAPSSVDTYNIAKIHKLLNAALNDESLQTFCFLHFEEVHNNFATGQTKAQRILALLDYVKRNAATQRLLTLLQEENPGQFDQFKPYHTV